jgi:hypothetical protein
MKTTITNAAAEGFGILRDAAAAEGFAALASQAAAEGPAAVEALAAAVHSGNGPESPEAHEWASGWACWAAHAHAAGNGPWSR